MYTYIVKAQGFYGGALYEPNGKRTKLVSPVKLEPVPSWLELEPSSLSSRASAPKSTTGRKTKKVVQSVDEDITEF